MSGMRLFFVLCANLLGFLGSIAMGVLTLVSIWNGQVGHSIAAFILFLLAYRIFQATPNE